MIQDFSCVGSSLGLDCVEMSVDLEVNPINGDLLSVSISAGQVH